MTIFTIDYYCRQKNRVSAYTLIIFIENNCKHRLIFLRNKKYYDILTIFLANIEHYVCYSFIYLTVHNFCQFSLSLRWEDHESNLRVI